MARLRPLTNADIPDVARLFHKVFEGGEGRVSSGLISYLHALYIDHLACAADIPSLVHLDQDDRISGFIGRHAIPFAHGDAKLRAALCSTIMVDADGRDPLAGARLLRGAFDGPQDFTFTESALDVSLHMWRSAGAVPIAGHSFDWLHPIRPVTFAVEMAGKRHRFTHALKPVARFGDNLFDRFWRAPTEPKAKAGGQSETTVSSVEDFADHFQALATRFSLRPQWDIDQLRLLITEASSKQKFGQPVFASVHKAGKLLGTFFYHVRPDGVGRVVQLVSAPGAESEVFSHLLKHASSLRASAVRGRVQPFLMDCMLGRRIVLINAASTLVHSRNPDLMAQLRGGHGFLNGVAGEQWSRLLGDIL
jgi:hypothetical protein